MTTKTRTKKAATPAPAPATDADKRNTLRVEDDGKKPMEQLRADLAADGMVANAAILASFSKPITGELGLTESLKALRTRADTVHGGDLKPVEDMLMSQAATLNALFCEMARRAGLNMGEYLDATETYMRMALKAQAQCRATLETLAEVKNPRAVAFVRQTNVAHGPQQVNNGASPAPSPARTKEPAGVTNGLLPAPAPGGGPVVDMAGAASRGEPQEVPR
ncbi:hypothetical protein [Azohydromonas aeria]|uniref:hypothetical protein n=1 Tax=Azohydromonas aeria TaxID=2590212 RepID=UPI0012FA4D31|nr:hypothetical protein [Azohydromonas aeria]